jgi:hypothetical protein
MIILALISVLPLIYCQAKFSYGAAFVYATDPNTNAQQCTSFPMMFTLYTQIGIPDNMRSEFACSTYLSTQDATYQRKVNNAQSMQDVFLSQDTRQGILKKNGKYMITTIYEDQKCAQGQGVLSVGVVLDECVPVDKLLPSFFGPYVKAQCDASGACLMTSYNDKACTSAAPTKDVGKTSAADSSTVDSTCRALVNTKFAKGTLLNVGSDGIFQGDIVATTSLSTTLYVEVMEEYNSENCANDHPYRKIKTVLIGPGCTQAKQTGNCETSQILTQKSRKVHCRILPTAGMLYEIIQEPGDETFIKEVTFVDPKCSEDQISKIRYWYYLKEANTLTCLNLSPFLSVNVGVQNQNTIIMDYHQGTCDAQVEASMPNIYTIGKCEDDKRTTGSIYFRN